MGMVAVIVFAFAAAATFSNDFHSVVTSSYCAVFHLCQYLQSIFEEELCIYCVYDKSHVPKIL